MRGDRNAVELSATKSAADAKFTMILSGETPRATKYDLAESARRSARASSAALGRSVLVRPLM